MGMYDLVCAVAGETRRQRILKDHGAWPKGSYAVPAVWQNYIVYN